MQLSFARLTLCSLRSFTEESLLDLQALGVGLHFVCGDNQVEPRLGSNGAGKSTLWAALTFALYGKTVGGLGRLDLQPWGTNTDPHVELELTKNNRQHVITRTGKVIELDGEIIAQDKLDKFLGLDFDTFTHTVLLGQGQPLFFDLRPQEKMELFASVLDLERFDRYSQAAHERTATLQQEVRTLETECAVIARELELVVETIERLQKQSDEFTAEVQRQVSESLSAIAALEQQLEAAQERLNEAELALDSAGTELKALRLQLPQVEEDYNTVHRNYLDFAADDRQRQQAIEQLEDNLRELEQGRCPTCGQSYSSAKAKHEHQVKLKRLKMQRGIPPVTIERLGELKAQCERLRTAASEFTHKVDRAQMTVSAQGPQVATLKTKVTMLKEAHEKLIQSSNPYYHQLHDNKRRAQSLRAQHDTKSARCALLQRRLARAQFWVKGFKELKLYVIEEILQELTLVTNAMLDDSGLVDWSIEYEVEQETKSGTVKRGIAVRVHSPSNEKPVKWEVWSGGEAQRLRVIGALALSETLLGAAGLTVSLEIVDEPTQHLSEEGVGDLCEFLAARAQRLQRQIFFSDQNSHERGLFDAVVTVIKDERGSRIAIQ